MSTTRNGPMPSGRGGKPASTVHAVQSAADQSALPHIWVSTPPLRRYAHDRPGSLIHVDVIKFGNIPDSGGWRYLGNNMARGARH